MKKINLAILLLVLFSLATAGPVMAGNMNKSGGGAALTPDEEAGLLFMREEEKLARDVYLFLYDMWGLRVFENIAASEQQHMDSVLYLLGKYELADPALASGEFQNSALQTLYNDLVEKGEKSVLDAIEVGIMIEETDISDINESLGLTDKKDIIQVYTNLLEGSYNHLAAFESHL